MCPRLSVFPWWIDAAKIVLATTFLFLGGIGVPMLVGAYMIRERKSYPADKTSVQGEIKLDEPVLSAGDRGDNEHTEQNPMVNITAGCLGHVKSVLSTLSITEGLSCGFHAAENIVDFYLEKMSHRNSVSGQDAKVMLDTVRTVLVVSRIASNEDVLKPAEECISAVMDDLEKFKQG